MSLSTSFIAQITLVLYAIRGGGSVRRCYSLASVLTITPLWVVTLNVLPVISHCGRQRRSFASQLRRRFSTRKQNYVLSAAMRHHWKCVQIKMYLLMLRYHSLINCWCFNTLFKCIPYFTLGHNIITSPRIIRGGTFTPGLDFTGELLRGKIIEKRSAFWHGNIIPRMGVILVLS